MIFLAIIVVILNFIAAYVTREGDSINQRSVNLHMLEDVHGCIVVLIGAIIMNYTDLRIIDSIISVSVFIFSKAVVNLKNGLDLFLEKAPDDINIGDLKKHLLEIKDIEDIHHIHVWSMDGFNNYATMHIVTKSKNVSELKTKIREELAEHNICHAILETEDSMCDDNECKIEVKTNMHHHH